MNDLSKFSAEGAVSFSDIAAKRHENNLNKEAIKIIDFVSKRYEKIIKKEVSKNHRCREVAIGLGYFHKIVGDDFFDIDKIIREHFRVLGFRSRLVKGKKCDCWLNVVCNHNQFYLHLSW